MKKLLTLALSLLLLFAAPLSLTSCGGDGFKSDNFEITDEVTDHVAILVKGYGTIIFELYPDIAPITVKNFKELVAERFYDGTVFHRVIKNFMIQGGQSASGERANVIVGEFELNGISNPLLHERGVVSMARTNFYNSASSQFFIVHKTSPHLDGKYAAFGKVLEGMDIVDKIAAVKTDATDCPIKAVTVSRIQFVKEKTAD